MSRDVNAVIEKLSDAMLAGKLDQRGDATGMSPKDAATVQHINRMIEALVSPMRLAGNALQQIAHGQLPPFVVDDHRGEFNLIKQNINSLLAILYGMNSETEHLVRSVGQGRLKTRGNDWDYAGIWKALIGGMNSMLDAVIAPISEAGAVLQSLARYDLTARMSGKYRGEHATIRKALNATAESLHDAIAQVSETVGLVSEVGKQITTISAGVTDGAERQSVQLQETSTSLAELSQSAQESAQSTAEALGNARQATDAIQQAKASMGRMLTSMGDIRGAADMTLVMADEIDGIAKETGALAGSVVEKTTRMQRSAEGFGVVAREIRNLSAQCSATAAAMRDLEAKPADDRRAESGRLIHSLLDIARFTKLLGVNAAIEAAHVDGAGESFRALTQAISALAVKSAAAANKTGDLTRASSALSASGVVLSQEIHSQLEGAVHGAEALSVFANDVSASMQDQTVGLEQISRTATEISSVTNRNAEGAAESLSAARNLEQQVGKLTRLVDRFARR